MKKWLAVLAMLMPLGLITGCEPFPSDDDEGKVEFVNKSTYNITVIPQAQSGWRGFSFAPGERKKFSDTYDVYFTYEPHTRVEVGDNKNGRIVFINKDADTVTLDN